MDYIKNAVELIDGLYFDEYDHLIGMGAVTYIEDLEWYHIDAIAAQLVRQVDALERWIVDAATNGTDILDDYDRGRLKTQVLGPDRTMNTIKAIVDSGVLE